MFVAFVRLVRVKSGIYRSMPLAEALNGDLERVLNLLMREADDDDTEEQLVGFVFFSKQ